MAEHSFNENTTRIDAVKDTLATPSISSKAEISLMSPSPTVGTLVALSVTTKENQETRREKPKTLPKPKLKVPGPVDKAMDNAPGDVMTPKVKPKIPPKPKMNVSKADTEFKEDTIIPDVDTLNEPVKVKPEVPPRPKSKGQRLLEHQNIGSPEGDRLPTQQKPKVAPKPSLKVQNPKENPEKSTPERIEKQNIKSDLKPTQNVEQLISLNLSQFAELVKTKEINIPPKATHLIEKPTKLSPIKLKKLNNKTPSLSIGLDKTRKEVAPPKLKDLAWKLAKIIPSKPVHDLKKPEDNTHSSANDQNEQCQVKDNNEEEITDKAKKPDDKVNSDSPRPDLKGNDLKTTLPTDITPPLVQPKVNTETYFDGLDIAISSKAYTLVNSYTNIDRSLVSSIPILYDADTIRSHMCCHKKHIEESDISKRLEEERIAHRKRVEEYREMEEEIKINEKMQEWKHQRHVRLEKEGSHTGKTEKHIEDLCKDEDTYQEIDPAEKVRLKLSKLEEERKKMKWLGDEYLDKLLKEEDVRQINNTNVQDEGTKQNQVEDNKQKNLGQNEEEEEGNEQRDHDKISNEVGHSDRKRKEEDGILNMEKRTDEIFNAEENCQILKAEENIISEALAGDESELNLRRKEIPKQEGDLAQENESQKRNCKDLEFSDKQESQYFGGQHKHNKLKPEDMQHVAEGCQEGKRRLAMVSDEGNISQRKHEEKPRRISALEEYCRKLKKSNKVDAVHRDKNLHGGLIGVPKGKEITGKNIEATAKEKNMKATEEGKNMEATEEEKNMEATEEEKNIEATAKETNMEATEVRKNTEATEERKNMEATETNMVATTAIKKNIEATEKSMEATEKNIEKNMEATKKNIEKNIDTTEKNIEKNMEATEKNMEETQKRTPLHTERSGFIEPTENKRRNGSIKIQPMTIHSRKIKYQPERGLRTVRNRDSHNVDRQVVGRCMQLQTEKEVREIRKRDKDEGSLERHETLREAGLRASREDIANPRMSVKPRVSLHVILLFAVVIIIFATVGAFYSSF